MLTETIKEFFASQAGQLSVWVLVVALLDFVLGLAAAIRDKTFELDAVAAWLRKHVAGRVIPIWVLLFAGHVADEWLLPITDTPAIMAIGLAAALAYVAETLGSILRSWGPSSGPAFLQRDPAQPVPEN